MKNFFCGDTKKVLLAMAGNASLSIVGKLTEWTHLLLLIGQAGVAIITIVYIWRKIRALTKRKE